MEKYISAAPTNLNRENFRRDISRQDWSYNSDDPNVLWADWKAKFLTIVNSHAPIKTKRVRSRKVPWVTSDLRKGMRDRDVAKRKAIKSNDPQDWAVYKRLRNKINGEVKSTKASYYANAFIQSNGNSRKTWQMINELTSRQKPIFTSFPMHLMITFQQLEPNLLMRYPLLLMVQVMPITLLAATTSSFSVQLVVAMFIRF